MLNVRAVVLDHYVGKPIDEINKEQNLAKQWQEPVIRVFGSTPDGIKTCVHIHGVYPYMYVPYKGGENPDRDSLLLGAALDEALKTSAKQKNLKFVYKVTLILGIPLYGYHSKPRQFFKIFFYNPYHIRRASDLLLRGAILGQKLQPHEAHIPFVLQFMMDYNIYGMSFVSFSKVKYRRNPENPDSLKGIKEEDILSNNVEKITNCYWEVDAQAKDITNNKNKTIKGGNPGLEAIWEAEKKRRRAQNRTSQLTVPESRSREMVKVTNTEVTFRERLAKKLQGISPKKLETSMNPEEPTLSYPAEAPENSCLLEASALHDNVHRSPLDDVEEDVPDVRELINETILSQVGEAEEENERGDSDDERREADSVLGRNQKEEEEVELEEEDMTQPLEEGEGLMFLPEADGDEPRTSDSESEKEFWKEMADKIVQLDGAPDSSSESDPDGSCNGGFMGFTPEAAPKVQDSSGDINTQNDLDWSTNILSILSEDSVCPTPSTTCQTPHSFWSSYSPQMDSWLSQTQEAWNWNKSDPTFEHCSPGNICDFPMAEKENELYVDLFGSNEDEYLNGDFKSGKNTENLGFDSAVSPPSAILTPASEADGNSDVISLPETSPYNLKSPSYSDGEKSVNKEKPKETFLNETTKSVEKEINKWKSSIANSEKGVKDVQEKTVPLTLKQYIKNCSEIVNVEFKNLGNREMVVIEYKSLNKKSDQSKFLIKPLDKFIEHWNIAEKKLNSKLPIKPEEKNPRWPKIINGFEKNSNKNKKSEDNSSRGGGDWPNVKSAEEEKLLEMPPTGNRKLIPDKLQNNCSKQYQVNENVISRGKIKMKLIKSQLRNIETKSRGRRSGGESFEGEGNYKTVDHPEKKINRNNKIREYERILEMKDKGNEINFDKDRREKNKMGNVLSKNLVKRGERIKLSELDSKLINQINSSFEEYFKNIVKLNAGHGKNENLSSQDVSEDEEELSESEDSNDNSKTHEKYNSGRHQNPDPVDFVTQLITTVSRMSNLSGMPPLSVTISLGASEPPKSTPIQLNFQPTVAPPPPLEQAKHGRRTRRRKMKIETVDGAVDSSSDDSMDSDSNFRRTASQKRIKRDAFYKPLNVVVRNSPSVQETKTNRKSGRSEEIKQNPTTSGQDMGSFVHRKRPQSSSNDQRLESGIQSSEQEGSSSFKSLKKREKILKPLTFEKNVAENRRSLRSSVEEEPDIIYDSEEEKKGKNPAAEGKSRKYRKRNPLKIWKKIPQTDVAVSSSDDEGKKRDRSEKVQKVPPSSSVLEVKKIVEELQMEVDFTEDNPEIPPMGISVDLQDEGKTHSENENIPISPPSPLMLNIKKSIKELNKEINVDEETELGRKTQTDSPVGGVKDKEKMADNENSQKASSPVVLNEEDNVVEELKEEEEMNENEELVEGIISFYDKTSLNPLDMEELNSSGSVKKFEETEHQQSVSPDVPILTQTINKPPVKSPSTSSSPQESIKNVVVDCESCAVPKTDSQTSAPLMSSASPSSEVKEDQVEELPKESPLTPAFNSKSSPSDFLHSSHSLSNYSEFTDYGISQVFGRMTIIPKWKPLTRSEVVELLAQKGIPENQSKAPFYGDPRDATKTMEIGFRVIKIESNSIAGLKSHKSVLGLKGTEELRSDLLELHGKSHDTKRWTLLSGKKITIVPLRKPPSRTKVVKWLKHKKKVKESTEKEEKAKVKLRNPLSPGQESDSDAEMEISMTLSPYVDEPSQPVGKSSGSSSDGSSLNFTSVTHSTPLVEKPESPKLTLKKGPLYKIKGIKRLKKLEIISEEKELSNKSKTSSDESRPSKEEKQSSDNSFQIRGITCDNTFGFVNSVDNLQDVKLDHTYQHMSILVIELHTKTRKDLRPDPQLDPIRALFYVISFDSPTQAQETGIIVVGENLLSRTGVTNATIHYVATEVALIEKALDLIKIWDPDILAGYEIEMNSWGYLIQRGFVLEMNLLSLLGRVKNENFGNKDVADLTKESDEFDDAPRSVRHMRISGRIVLDIWRVLRHEISLTSYTFENVMYHLTHERHPLLSHKTLSFCWEHPTRRLQFITFEHYITRVEGILLLLNQIDFINRTSELSRLFGIQFYEVLSRGSQYRVESMMLRLAKPLNYVPASPSIAQRANMRAPASLPLILEPESIFYTDPVIVLDFQSLYPSMIIAYNYCFSTCLGRVENLGGREPFEFGCTHLQISPEELKELENDLTFSPAGVAFVKSNIRKGVLPAMLEEILETRLMVKKSMKENKGKKVLEKILFARQLGLKLIANVTYGYTAANFSGRMPCIEVGDSVVSKGRETLYRAIQMVKNTAKWGAKVVYGDTDSIFVLTPGRTLQEAFQIGAEIAEAVTQDNPKPVKLKLEKVYQPCILQTKKRYVGYMYESPDQKEPVFEAKGIETVRRDGCPAIGKILRKSLQILFDTRDVSLVKKYTIRQFTKLFQGKVNTQDLIFAKEYRGRKGYRPGACVPALQLAKQWTQYDKRAEPRVKERVPYVIVNGPPGVPLIRLVRSPKDLLNDPSLRINAVYYITKAIIPPMQRCFSLLGVDVMAWYGEMPRKYHKMYKAAFAEAEKRRTISQYFSTVECVVCSEITNEPVCPKCRGCPQLISVSLVDKIRRLERCHDGILKICQSCCGRTTEIECQSLDCPVLFRKNQASRDVEQVTSLRQILDRYL